MNSADRQTASSFTVRVPITIRKRGGRKFILSPSGIEASDCHSEPAVDNATVRAIARAYRWRDMIENGTYSTIREIAIAEKINEAYVGRVLRLTLLAPPIIDAIVMGQPTDGRQLHDLMQKMPADWQAQFRPKI